MKLTIKNTIATSLIALGLTVGIAQTVVAGGYGQQQPRAVTSTLSRAETDVMIFMREEEKLARDVYDTLYEQWGLTVFNNISDAEQKHADKILGLLNRYGIADPVIDDTTGIFQQQALTDLYYQLLAHGQSSKQDALYVGAFVEETDILDLRKAIAGTSRPDIIRVYESLMNASYQHLRTFVAQIKRMNGTGIYAAQAMSQQEVDEILDDTQQQGQREGRGKQRGKGQGMQ